MKEEIRLTEMKNGKRMFDTAVRKIEDRIESGNELQAFVFDERSLYIEQFVDEIKETRVFKLFKNYPYDWTEYSSSTFAYALDDAIAFWSYPEKEEVRELLHEWRQEYEQKKKNSSSEE